MIEKLKAALAAFVATPTGHTLELSLTAAAATAAGVYMTGHDAHAAEAAFVAGAIIAVRTAVRQYLKADTDPTKR